MDLFVVNRYWSEDRSDETDKSTENDLLEKLKQRASSKKKSKDLSTEVGPLTKKVKLNDETVCQENVDVVEAPNQAERISKKKKKKRAKKTEVPLTVDGFQVLGEVVPAKKEKVKPFLPTWLACPNFIPVDLQDQQMPIQDMPGLDECLQTQLKSNGVEYFFPVQRLVIPWLLRSERFKFYRPNDICVSAPTGSGKTLAFVLPIVQALKTRIVPKVRALVILPVQELATQVFKVFQSYCETTNLRVKLVSGQKSFSQEQIELVKVGNVGTYHSLVDILIATPGRIVDHILKTDGFDLTHLRYLIIDEADRVMEDIQNDWLTHVEDAVYKGNSFRKKIGRINVRSAKDFTNIPLQKLLFSATLSTEPEILYRMNLYEPKMFATSVDPDSILAKGTTPGKEYTTPKELKEMFIRCENPLMKPLLLFHLIKSKLMTKALIFTKSIENSHSLAVLLKQLGLSVDELSSRVTEKRVKALNKFKNGSLDLLVCTEALARGIDIGSIDYVVSYDLPLFIAAYIHRVGRTARAGKSGVAITIVEKNKQHKFSLLMKEAGKLDSIEEIKVKAGELEYLTESYESARSETSRVLESEKKVAGEKKRTSSFGKNKIKTSK